MCFFFRKNFQITQELNNSGMVENDGLNLNHGDNVYETFSDKLKEENV